MRSALACLLLLAAGCSNAPAGGSYARGVAALEKGDAKAARVEFLNLLKDEPGNKAARIMQARTYIALGDGLAAQTEIERARAQGVAPAITRPLMAHAYLLQDQPEEALREVASATGGGAEHMRGRALAALGRLEEAGAAYDRAVALAPKDDRLWTDVARFRRANGELAGAIAAADRAVAANPASADALTLRGELTRSQYGLRAALPWFDRAIAIDGSNVTARLERAATLGDMGAMHAMLSETRKVLARSPGNAMAYYLQAMLAARARNFTVARALYQRTQGKLDNQPSAMLLAGAIDFATGDPRGASGRLARLVELQPDNRRARRLLAAAQWRSGDAKGTVATLRPLADRDDADSYALSLIGAALAKLGEAEAASTYLARAAWPDRRAPSALFDQAVDMATLEALRVEAEASPGDAAAQVRLIRAQLGSGQQGEALDRARRLQAANPGAPDAHMLVGDALELRGDYRGAVEQYRRAANIAFTEPVAMRMIEALERSGQAEAAGEVLSLFLDQNPRSLPGQLLAAARFMAAHDWREAIRIYERLRRQTGDNDAAMLNNLALAYAQQDDFEHALPIARRAWLLDRSNSTATDTYGWLLYKSGDKAHGLALLLQASRGAPDATRIRTRLDALSAAERRVKRKG